MSAPTTDEFVTIRNHAKAVGLTVARSGSVARLKRDDIDGWAASVYLMWDTVRECIANGTLAETFDSMATSVCGSIGRL